MSEVQEDPRIRRALDRGLFVLASKADKRYIESNKSKKALMRYAGKTYPEAEWPKLAVYIPTPNKSVKLYNGSAVSRTASITGYNGNVTLENKLDENYGGGSTKITITQDELVKILKAHPNASNIVKACLRK